jgi:hypothetical protein
VREDRNNPGEVFVRQLTRNVLLGTVVMYGVTLALCIPAGSVGMAAGIAVLPGVVAGPFVGGLVTLVTAAHRSAANDAIAASIPALIASPSVAARPAA